MEMDATLILDHPISKEKVDKIEDKMRLKDVLNEASRPE